MDNELLKNLTTCCPSGTLLQNVSNLKIETILKSIDSTNFISERNNGYIIAVHKNFDPNKKFITISSHIDNVYGKCFFDSNETTLTGTFDNSATNYIALRLMQNINLQQVVFIFTDGEENGVANILQVYLFKNKKFLFNICLDVTPYCHFTHFATIENDNHNLAKKIRKNKGVALIPVYQSKTDESTYLSNNKVKSFSYCLTINFDANRCHSELGGALTCENLDKYYSVLKNFLDNYRF